MKRILNVCVTGACGKIAYSLYNILCSGDPFGLNVEINLKLLDLDQKINALKALKIELQDCSFKQVSKIQIYTQEAQLFQDADVVIFLGSMARRPGMDREQFFQANAQIFRKQGKALNLYAKKTCKSLVVANPVNTNCLILSSNASTIPVQNFTALSRVNYNRLTTQLSQIFQCPAKNIKNHIIWGNHSVNQYRDLSKVEVQNVSHELVQQKLEQINIEEVSKNMADRNSLVLDVNQSGCLMLNVKAIYDHLYDWFRGSHKIVSMGVILKKEKYGIQPNLCYSLPTVCTGNGQYKIVSDLVMAQSQKNRLIDCTQQLLKQKALILDYLPVEK